MGTLEASRPPRATQGLLVVSDGLPRDRLTAEVNGTDYLAAHLSDVVSSLEASGGSELHAIGVGHPVGRFYRHSVMIREPAQLAPVLTDRLCGILLYPRSGRRAPGG